MKTVLISALLMGACLFPAFAQEAGQKTFPSADAAAEAMVSAVADNDAKTLSALVGSKAKNVLESGDAKRDAADRAAFLAACKQKLHVLAIDDSHAMLIVGSQNFPFPIPLVKGKAAWYFDGTLAEQEMLARRIGENELATIRACQAYTQAQLEYARLDPDGSGMAKYAEHLQSTKGHHDGLYWAPAPGEVLSPLGPFLAQTGRTQAETGKPFHGYHFRILTSQGADAPGGAYSYIINGHMVAGFALVAYPATYGATGIMTFLVGPAGIVYERDLGQDTPEFGRSLSTFNPDKGWKRL